jgi:F0F1-type ATP synthase delta subunit
LGGFRLTIDDLQLDASVATQFERIKKQFVEQNKRIV